MPATTLDANYLGVPLTNPEPGVSDAVDYLGRHIGQNNTDYMGRSLVDAPDQAGAVLPAELPLTFEES